MWQVSLRLLRKHNQREWWNHYLEHLFQFLIWISIQKKLMKVVLIKIQNLQLLWRAKSCLLLLLRLLHQRFKWLLITFLWILHRLLHCLKPITLTRLFAHSQQEEILKFLISRVWLQSWRLCQIATTICSEELLKNYDYNSLR